MTSLPARSDALLGLREQAGHRRVGGRLRPRKGTFATMPVRILLKSWAIPPASTAEGLDFFYLEEFVFEPYAFADITDMFDDAEQFSGPGVPPRKRIHLGPADPVALCVALVDDLGR